MAKATKKIAKGKNKSNQPSEAAASNTDKKAGLSLNIDDTGSGLTDHFSAAYKSDLNMAEEPYWGIVPMAKRPQSQPSPLATSTILARQQLTCLITGVTATTVIAEALVDRRNGIIQTRRFDKLPLMGVVNCQEGTLFNLTIVTSPGRREFLYRPGNPDDSKYFEETLVDITSLRNDLKNDPNFQREPDTDDGHTF
jgi:hypothetical protein